MINIDMDNSFDKYIFLFILAWTFMQRITYNYLTPFKGEINWVSHEKISYIHGCK